MAIMLNSRSKVYENIFFASQPPDSSTILQIAGIAVRLRSYWTKPRENNEDNDCNEDDAKNFHYFPSATGIRFCHITTKLNRGQAA